MTRDSQSSPWIRVQLVGRDIVVTNLGTSVLVEMGTRSQVLQDGDTLTAPITVSS